MNALKHAALIAATVLIPAFALAQNATPTTPATPAVHTHKFEARFAAADKNGDGALTRAEADSAGMKRLTKNFDTIDTNKDGKVTRAEFIAFRKAHKHAHQDTSNTKPAAPVK